ncbi:CinA family protein [Sphingobacterium kyonggiense]
MSQINHIQLNELGNQLQERGLSLAFVESMTAGFMSSVWSLQVDAGKCLKGGIVCFHESVKTDLLKVPTTLIKQYTAESMEVTMAMLAGLKKLIDADIYFSITGRAYEGEEPNPHAVEGEVFLICSCEEHILQQRLYIAANNAADIYIETFNASLNILEELLHLKWLYDHPLQES